MSAWVSQQLREAFPYNPTAKYLIFDRATNFSEEVISTIKNLGIDPCGPASAARGRMALPSAL